MAKKNIPDCCSKLFSGLKPGKETINAMNEQCKKLTGYTCEEFFAQMGSFFQAAVKKKK